MQTPDDIWVFAYGSLLWNPGFAVAETRPARLVGYRRSFSMRSIHHRGTETAPGLVLALDADPTAECRGLALRIDRSGIDQALADLRERELVSSAYFEKTLTIDCDGGAVDALCYIIDPGHVQYCGGLPLEEQAQIISAAVGGRGPNFEYLFNTVDHLTDMGIEDPNLTWLRNRVAAIRAVKAQTKGTLDGTAPGA